MKKFISILLVFVMALPIILTAVSCKKDNGGNPQPPQPQVVELVKDVHYSDGIGVYDDLAKAESEVVFDKDVFYRNDTPLIGADPFVLYCNDETDTEHYGDYYLFGTMGVGVLNCYKSRDLVSWESHKAAYVYPADSWENADSWAPEFIWDKDADPADYGLEDDGMGQGVYFLFSSSQVASSMVIQSGKNLYPDYLTLAVSASPDGPYKQWKGKELGATIGGVDYGKAENYAEWTTYADESDLNAYAMTHYVGRKNDVVDADDPWFNASAARASLHFQYIHKEKAGNWVDADGNIVNANTSGATYIPESAKNIVEDGSIRDFTVIDPSPFIDKDGTKYLYIARFCHGMLDERDDKGYLYPRNSVYVVKFVDNDWSQIDYSSLTRITRNLYNFVNEGDAETYNEQAQAFNPDLYEKGVKETRTFDMHLCNAETHVATDGLNEGPVVIYKEESGLYYLNMSTGVYTDNSYTVLTAVAYSPTGPFRKLDIDEGGFMLTTNFGNSTDIVTGPGHNTLISVGDEDYIIYHRHLDLTKSIHSRGAVIDKIVWLANDYGMMIPHVNGPTTTIQPKIYNNGSTKYDNIIEDATVTIAGDGVTGKNYLTDGAVQMHEDAYQPYVGEMEFTGDSITITVKFDSYRIVRALMMYQSYNYNTAFEKIKRIEMDVKNNGVEGTYVIKDLAFPWDMGLKANGDTLRAGVAATATFSEVAVKEIRLTVDNYNNFDGYSGITAISELMVLGIPEEVQNAGSGNGSTLIPDTYVNKSLQPKNPAVYGDISLDGDLSDWDNIDKLSISLPIGGVNHDIETASYYAEEGLVLYYKVMGAPVYYNPGRGAAHNTGVELFLAPDNTSELLGGAFEMELSPTGNVTVKKFIRAGQNPQQYLTHYMPGIKVVGDIYGELNSPSSTGYAIEVIIPWSTVGYDSMPEAVCVNFAITYSTTYESAQREAWVNIGEQIVDGYGWGTPNTWWKVTKYGYFDSNDTFTTEINNGNAVLNGEVEVSGDYLSGGKVEITPDAGYKLKSLTINGKPVDLLVYEFAPRSCYYLDIDVEFEQVTDTERQITVKGGFEYGEELLIANTAITFTNGNAIYAGKTDANGVLNIAIPNGEYTVVSPKYNSISVVIDNNFAEFKLIRKVLTTGNYNGVEVVNNGVDGYSFINNVGSSAYLPSIYFDDSIDLQTIYYEAYVTIPKAAHNTWLIFKFEQGTSLVTYSYINVGIWNGTLHLKPLNLSDGAVQVYTLNADINNDGVLDAYKIKLAVAMANNDDGTAYISYFYDSNNSGLKLIASKTIGSAVKGCFLTTNTIITDNFKIENLKIYDGQEAQSKYISKINVSAPNTVEVDNAYNFIPYGASATIKVDVKPVAGDDVTVIKSIKVNGQETDYTFNDENQIVFTIKNNSTTSIDYNVVIETETVGSHNVNFNFINLDGTVFAGDVELFGAERHILTTTGSSNVKLAEGDYYAYTKGMVKIPFTINADTQEVEIKFIENIFREDNIDKFEITAGEYGTNLVYNGDATEEIFTAYIKANSFSNFAIEYTVVAPLSSLYTFVPFKIQPLNNGVATPQYYYLNAGVLTDCIKLKPFNKDATAVLFPANVDTNNDSVKDTVSVRLRVTIEDNLDGSSTVVMYYYNGDNLVYLDSAVGANPEQCMFLTSSADITGPFAVENIVVDTNADKNGKIVVGETDESIVKVSKNDIMPYNKAMVTITPKPAKTGANYIKSIKVNDQAITDYQTADNGDISFYIRHNTLTATTYTVKVETVNVSLKPVSVTVKTGFGKDNISNFTGTLSFTGGYSTSVNVSNGTATVKLAVGNYIVTGTNCYPITVVVGDDTTSLDMFIAKDLIDNNLVADGYNDTDGYYFTALDAPKNYYKLNNMFDYSNGFEYSYVLDLKTTSNSKFYPGLYVHGRDANNNEVSLRVQMTVWAGNLTLKDLVLVKEFATAGVGNNVLNLKAVVTKNGDGNFEISYYANGQLKITTSAANAAAGATVTTLKTIEYISLYSDKTAGTDGSWMIKNFMVKPLA